MKIAIVAPRGVPYVVGGAEKLWWGLRDGLRRYTDHEVELLAFEAAESNFRELMASYRAFSELQLDHFDLVISTKYPAWMVRHHNHYVYLQHRLRGLYDTYPAQMLPAQLPPAQLPLAVDSWPQAAQELSELQQLQELLASAPAAARTAELFDCLDGLQAKLTDSQWDELFAFPGPATRRVVHWLDASALAAGAIKKFMAISETVKARADYFPAAVPVQVIHHPSDLAPAEQRPGEYLLAVSRLDHPKRLDLLIAAMALVKADVKLKIAGTGPQEAALKAMAAADSRISFCGWVEDEALRELYSGALLVPFLPADEDYGLITVEAMQAGKPVLTTTDAGGVTELVEPDTSGWVVAPEPAALAATIDQQLSDPAGLYAMARACRERVADINWQATVEKLLDASGVHDNDGFLQAGKPRRIVVAVSFPVYPPDSGGTNRIFHLYRHIAYYTPVTLVTLTSTQHQPFEAEIAPGLREVRVPKTAAHEAAEFELEQRLGASVGDLFAIEHIEMTPAYLHALRDACADADLVVASHPYLYPAIGLCWRGPVVYEAHNVELDMKRDILGEDEYSRSWLALTNSVEGDCCRNAVGISACSEQDRQRLCQLYTLAPESVAVVPNGADLTTLPSISVADRLRVQTRMGNKGRFTALFIGSWHGPNIEAMHFILEELAPALPAVDFWIGGNVCREASSGGPGNVHLFGVLQESDKNALLACARLALNPMGSGSGSNLKMAEYLAAGLPVLSTPFGARGITFCGSDRIWTAELGNFAEKLDYLVNEVDWSALKGRVSTGLLPAHAEHDWRIIADDYYAFLVLLGMNSVTLC